MVGQTKVFVGSLPPGSKPEELRRLFEKFGVVTECDIMNRCGFVHMETQDQADAAIQALHSSSFNGGTITVERGRLKDRSQRGGPGGRGGGRGGMRNMGERRGGGPMRGGPMRRGGHMGGREGGAPYMRDSRPMRGDMRNAMGGMRNNMGGGMDMRNGMAGGMGMRNGMGGGGGGYDRPIERAQLTMGGNYDDRYNNYGVEDRRGFALMDGRGAARDPYEAAPRDPYVAPVRDPYAAPAAEMYDDRRAGYVGAPIDSIGGSMGYADDRRAPMYDERDMMDRRGGNMRPIPVNTGYDRAAPRSAMGNGDIYSRRADMGAGGGMGGNMGGGYNRDPYQQQYAPIGRVGGGGGGARPANMAQRRY